MSFWKYVDVLLVSLCPSSVTQGNNIPIHSTNHPLVNSEGLFRNGSISNSFHSNMYTITTLKFPITGSWIEQIGRL